MFEIETAEGEGKPLDWCGVTVWWRYETEDGDVAMCYCEGFIVSILVLA